MFSLLRNNSSQRGLLIDVGKDLEDLETIDY